MNELLASHHEEDSDAEHIGPTVEFIAAHYGNLMDPSTREQVIEDMSYEEFRQYLIGVNATLRGKIPEGHTFDSKDMVLAGGLNEYETPEDSDKDELLRDIFETTHTIEPYDRGLVLALGVNLVHAFGARNGGLSRLTFTLFGDRDTVASTPEALHRILSHDGREELDVSPIPITSLIGRRMLENEAFVGAGSPRLAYDQQAAEQALENIPSELRTKFIRMLRTSRDDLARLAVFEHIHNNQDTTALYIEPEHEGASSITHLYPEVLESLNEEEVQDILERFRQLKKDSVLMMIDSLTHPDKYPLPDINDRHHYGNIRGYLLGWPLSKIPKPAPADLLVS